MYRKTYPMVNIADKALVVVPPPPPRFSLDEWYLNNIHRYRNATDQQQLADRILKECDRIRDATAEATKSDKDEVDHRIEQKIIDIEFRKKELEKQRKEACIEIDALNLYKERIMNALDNIRERAMKICKKCIILREGRLGIDLVHDDIERELRKEIEVIQGAQALLKSLLEQAHEQIRRLKSSIYFIDRDLEDKDNAIKIDKHNKILNETSLNLSVYHGKTDLDIANITPEEWERYSEKNIENAAKEVNGARPLRTYVDIVLKQIVEDLMNQYDAVNEAFRRRILETKAAKYKLEQQHAETARQANEMTRNITRLEKAIAEKEGFLALAHTRLGNRAQRPGIELVKDLVEAKLVEEVHDIGQNVAALQQMLVEAQASLRYLLKNQIQLEEDINIKTNTLKIDDVDCMVIRQSMEYHAY